MDLPYKASEQLVQSLIYMPLRTTHQLVLFYVNMFAKQNALLHILGRACSPSKPADGILYVSQHTRRLAILQCLEDVSTTQVMVIRSGATKDVDVSSLTQTSLGSE